MRGETGEENFLSWEKFPWSAFSKTYNTDLQTADSAGTATAYLNGVKTRGGSVIRVLIARVSRVNACTAFEFMPIAVRKQVQTASFSLNDDQIPMKPASIGYMPSTSHKQLDLGFPTTNKSNKSLFNVVIRGVVAESP
jgi:hypothetical protein